MPPNVCYDTADDEEEGKEDCSSSFAPTHSLATLLEFLFHIDDRAGSNGGICSGRDFAGFRLGVSGGKDGTSREFREERGLASWDDTELEIDRSSRVPPTRHEVDSDRARGKFYIFPDSDTGAFSCRGVKIDVSLVGVEASVVPFDFERLQSIDDLLVGWGLVETTSLASWVG